ncbi:MAG: hypothetical protein OEX12_00155 [Gammaproteobacteria bacterium]|nr:hypothetical protein [Gammaproteobacteria bacterium]
MFGILNVTDNTSDTGDDSLLNAVFTAPVSIRSHRIRSSSDTLSLKVRRAEGTAQRWEFQTGAHIINSTGHHLFTQRLIQGISNSVYIRPPLPLKKESHTVGLLRKSSEVVPSEVSPTDSSEYAFSEGTAKTNAAYSAAASTFAVTLDISSKIFESDFIRFAGHDKLYLIHNLAVNKDTHVVTFATIPGLVAPVANAETVYLGKNATAKCILDMDAASGMTYGDGILEDLGNIILVEDL